MARNRNTQPQNQTPQVDVNVDDTTPKTQEEEVKSRYNKGQNLYKIALAVYGFDNDDVVRKVKKVLGIMQEPEEKLDEE